MKHQHAFLEEEISTWEDLTPLSAPNFAAFVISIMEFRSAGTKGKECGHVKPTSAFQKFPGNMFCSSVSMLYLSSLSEADAS